MNTRNLNKRDDGNGNANSGNANSGGVAALKISAFARKYDLCPVTVRRLIQRGELRMIKLGGIVRVLDDVAGTPAGSDSDGEAA